MNPPPTSLPITSLGVIPMHQPTSHNGVQNRIRELCQCEANSVEAVKA